MVEYFNAQRLLPPDLFARVLKYIPGQNRYGAVLYFRDDYYTSRNGEIISLFRIYQDDPNFGSNSEIYEALSEQFGLTVRQICRILDGNREPFRRRIIHRATGTRVTRSTRKEYKNLPYGV